MMMMILMKVRLMIMPGLPLRNPKSVSASEILNDRVNFMIYCKCVSLDSGHRNSSVSELLDSENPTPRIRDSSSSSSVMVLARVMVLAHVMVLASVMV